MKKAIFNDTAKQMAELALQDVDADRDKYVEHSNASCARILRQNMEIAECGQKALAQFSTHTTFAWQESNFGNEASAFCQKYEHVRTFGRVHVSK